jgi:hypothetical protein
MTPFDYINSINRKSGILTDMSGYSVFLTNRAFSYFPDTILFANELNRQNIPPSLHYKCLYRLIIKKNRYTPWPKKTANNQEHIEIVMKYYNCNFTRAREYCEILSDEDIDEMKSYLNEGGK